MRPVRVTKKPKKTKKPDSGKLGVRPDHPRRPIEISFCVVGGLPAVVIYFKFHQNRSRGLRDMGRQNLPLPTDLAIGLYNSLHYRASRDLNRTSINFSEAYSAEKSVWN